MKTGSLLGDTFEKIGDLGKSTVKAAGKAVKSVTIDAAAKAAQEVAGSGSRSDKQSNKNGKGVEKIEKGQTTNQNYTPLDDDRLNELDELHKRQELTEVRQKIEHYFRRQKGEEARVIEERRKEEEERVQVEEQEENLKKRKKEEEKQAQPAEIPKGKERKSIFAFKRKIKGTQAETRVGSGKQ